jgi:flagellar hook-associated protein 1 FlgK
MSISGTLVTAQSGLNAASRAIEVVASNIANARTEGYARRELVLTSRSHSMTGQSVSVAGVRRNVDANLIADRRIADSARSEGDTRAGLFRDLERILGVPGDDGSFTSRVAAFETALIAATARPESTSRLADVLNAAQAVTTLVQEGARTVQQVRSEADRAIGADVETLNLALERIADSNARISHAVATKRDTSVLLDERQRLIDTIAEIVPVREMVRDRGQIALYTMSGAVLVDDVPSRFSYDTVGIVTAEMTRASGALSGLQLNGRELEPDGPFSGIRGGRLAAHFAVRDTLGPAEQDRLDRFARDLVERFADTGVDGTLTGDAHGLFIDTGGASGAVVQAGLAGRLGINPAADPEAGGALWRLRDGLEAAAPGNPGDATLLSAMHGALTSPRLPAWAEPGTPSRSIGSFAADVTSAVATIRLNEEGKATFAAARAAVLRDQELAGGVDTDREMEMLLEIEQGYAANARIIQSVDEMLKQLLEM